MNRKDFRPYDNMSSGSSKSYTPRASNRGVAEAFANGKTAKSGSMYSTGNKLYSYNTVIATRQSDGTVVLNNTKYSPTTSKQQSLVRQELSRAGVKVSGVTGGKDRGYLGEDFAEDVHESRRDSRHEGEDYREKYSVKDLRVYKFDNKLYFRDDRLGEYRNINNPNDVHKINDVDNSKLQKPTEKDKQKLGQHDRSIGKNFPQNHESSKKLTEISREESTHAKELKQLESNSEIREVDVPRGSGNNPSGGKTDKKYKIVKWGYLFNSRKDAENYLRTHEEKNGIIVEKNTKNNK